MRHIGICFVPGTKIIMGDGSEKNIEDVVKGDLIKSYDFENDEIVTNEVLEITEKPKSNLKIIMHLENKVSIEFSPSHPFWIVDEGWSVFDPKVGHQIGDKPLNSIIKGDKVLYYNNGFLEESEIISLEKTDKIVKMYNLNHVAGSHTFFANRVLVHNNR